MTSERTIKASDHARGADHGLEESLPFSLVVILHLLPAALLMGVALLLAPPLIERGVPYELVHIASGLLIMVPFIAVKYPYSAVLPLSLRYITASLLLWCLALVTTAFCPRTSSKNAERSGKKVRYS